MAQEGTLRERILVHLLAHPVSPDAADVPRAVTQDGIADATGARVGHVSRALQKLQAEGFAGAHLAHRQGARRKSRAHHLTDTGVAAARPLRERGVTSGTESIPRKTTPGAPFDGHNGTHSRLRELLGEVAREKGPRLALIEGDAGIGKTRLLERFAAAAEQSGAHILRGAAGPADRPQALGPLLSALEPHGLHAAYDARPAGSDGDRLVAAATDIGTRLAAERPCAILIDDIHLAGAGAIANLQGMLRQLAAGTRILFVVTFRREERWGVPLSPLYAQLTQLRTLPQTHLLTLEPFSPDEIGRLLRSEGHTLEGDVLDRLIKESGGLPHYALAIADETLDGIDESDFFPASVAARTAEQLSGLGEDVELVLQLAAARGTTITYDLLLRASGLDEDKLVGALDAALNRRLLSESGAGQRLAFEFHHPALRQALLENMSGARRRMIESRLEPA